MEQRIVLAVGGDQPVQALGLEHARAHHVGVLHAVAVVGEGDHVSCHAVHVGKGLPVLVHGDGAVGEDLDHRVLFDDVQLLLQVRCAVRRGAQIRHGANAGIPAAGCRPCAGGDGLLIGKARLSQMHVNICETGHTIQGMVGEGGLRRGDGDNFPAGNGDVRGDESPADVGQNAADGSLQGACLPSSGTAEKNLPDAAGRQSAARRRGGACADMVNLAGISYRIKDLFSWVVF